MSVRNRVVCPKYHEVISRNNAKSEVWELFGFPGDENGKIITEMVAVCQLCRCPVSSKATSNLWSHLRYHHPLEYKKQYSGLKDKPRGTEEGTQSEEEISHETAFSRGAEFYRRTTLSRDATFQRKIALSREAAKKLSVSSVFCQTSEDFETSGTLSKDNDSNIRLEPAIEIKEEPTDYLQTSSSKDASNEEFILPNEDDSWSSPDAIMAPQFTLSLANLGPPDPPNATDSEQPSKKRKVDIATHMSPTNGPETSAQNPPPQNSESVSNPESSKEPRKNHLEVFGEYVIAKLGNLDRISCAYAQKAISDIIFDAEMGKYLNKS